MGTHEKVVARRGDRVDVTGTSTSTGTSTGTGTGTGTVGGGDRDRGFGGEDLHVEAARARRWSGAGLLLIGALALVRAHLAAQPPPDVWTLGESIPLDIESLAGEDFRLLPGVGPVLAGRLEAARVAAGGRLQPGDLHTVPGVGPTLRGRWQALRTH